MKKRFKKSAFFIVVFGFLIFALGAYFGFQQYEIITNGEEVAGKVSRIISKNSNDGTTYTPEISYRHQGERKTYTPSYSSSINNYVVGDPVTLLVSDSGVTFKGFNGNLAGVLLAIGIGLATVIFGIIWFFKSRRHFDEVARLKQYGNRVQARFVKQESLGHSVDGHSGVILSFQGEGSNRIFKTPPIFSEFSIKWLEEHSFDVYVDPRDHSKYFVDLEKHFGHPQSH